MTIDEAIARCLEVAEQNETQAQKIGRQLAGSAIDKYATDCRECAASHKQLAEWLKEFKTYKEMQEQKTLKSDFQYSFNVRKMQVEQHKFYVIESNVLKGCVAQGDTLNEALTLFLECEKDWLNTSAKYNIQVNTLEEESICCDFLPEELIGIFGALCDFMIDNDLCADKCPFAHTDDTEGVCKVWRRIGYIRKILYDKNEGIADNRQLVVWLKELKEAKRLLKLALEQTNPKCKYCIHDLEEEQPNYNPCCTGETANCKWIYADEADKLLKEG